MNDIARLRLQLNIAFLLIIALTVLLFFVVTNTQNEVKEIKDYLNHFAVGYGEGFLDNCFHVEWWNYDDDGILIEKIRLGDNCLE